MTFIAPRPAVGTPCDVARPLPFRAWVSKASRRIGAGDEDGARRALGSDPSALVPLSRGDALQHLARIALG